MPNIETALVILNTLQTLAASARDARYLLGCLGEVMAWAKRKRQQHHQDSAENNRGLGLPPEA